MGSYGNQGGKRGLITDYPGTIGGEVAKALQERAAGVTLIGVDTARGRRMVAVEDLGLVIDALASRLGEVEELLADDPLRNLVCKDDAADAQLLLRINPDYASICNPIIAAYEAEEGE